MLDEKKREREKLGSVNLRADEETTKYETEIKKMETDRQDLVQAITKLKESINELNQKGRERLLEAFERVNRKFNEVYTKLFNGGNAKLELVDSDDPLDAGLEMLVSPPGKRLQSITLLSGGEQALTALSLIFAVFLSNPSPKDTRGFHPNLSLTFSKSMNCVSISPEVVRPFIASIIGPRSFSLLSFK